MGSTFVMFTCNISNNYSIFLSMVYREMREWCTNAINVLFCNKYDFIAHELDELILFIKSMCSVPRRRLPKVCMSSF